MRVAAGEVGEERDERCVVDAFVGGESRAVEPTPAGLRYVIDEENASRAPLGIIPWESMMPRTPRSPGDRRTRHPGYGSCRGSLVR